MSGQFHLNSDKVKAFSYFQIREKFTKNSLNTLFNAPKVYQGQYSQPESQIIFDKPLNKEVKIRITQNNQSHLHDPAIIPEQKFIKRDLAPYEKNENPNIVKFQNRNPRAKEQYMSKHEGTNFPSSETNTKEQIKRRIVTKPGFMKSDLGF
ncbi:Hypothetical_protein [Hexamita inflata]|uniref:Hypothetical_protein n=1 Tax=Hexamita inflata TaxID=28002 RepID=A0AA86PMH2_9EUKA|nr:Hypothetical protein HINF_LOCUS30274 [Hexamita inflata]